MNAPMSSATMPMNRPGSCGNPGQLCKCGGGCGGPGCQTDTMVRPRFFAGQLLLEDDLQSMENYVLAKNRLHNRRLFGDGVVCGFEVLCHPCGGGKVVVEPGYALDCCGNDIVLSCRAELDINAMIRDLRQRQLGGYDCGDPCPPMGQHGIQYSTTNTDKKVTREYCLYVHYCEQETDPVSPYSPDQPCTPTVCEPSRIREGLRFELRCPEKPQPPNDFLAALWCCLEDVVGKEKMSQDALTLEGMEHYVKEWAAGIRRTGVSAADLRDRLLALIEQSPRRVGCKLQERVLAVKLPSTSEVVKGEAHRGSEEPPTEEKGDKQVADTLVSIFVEILRDCVCSAVIPPCLDCTNTGVLLACLKVKDCDVSEICNLSRRFVVSPAAVRYWQGVGRVEHALQRVCCMDPCCGHVDDRQASAEDQKVAGTVESPQRENVLPAIAPSARLVQAAVREVERLQPPGSMAAAQLSRIEKAFGILAGKPEREPDHDRRAEKEDSIVERAMVQIREKFQSELERGAKAIEDVAELRTQMEKLQKELAEMKRTQKKQGGQDG
ncbi:hypothetical protein LMG28614_00729 [Paraburkholderia ultramafica]|uniref:Uncharacterized protein n=1 Tax=Paraburkholderia ultramafica TaxID=1544867 RepID=A0A6S7AV02_9BURK|nr:hypothetical protein [Paraburkholderia ultramafica]CAB3778780.1 hypothetical protein LMG28614_00729 [Paraburkholderia ultramafica]